MRFVMILIKLLCMYVSYDLHVSMNWIRST